LNDRNARFTPEQTPNCYRTEQQVDRDRILYCPNLARLAEVTQVRAIDGGVLVHNRLRHSLKVAQLARRIAEKLIDRQEELAGSSALTWMPPKLPASRTKWAPALWTHR
jgi:dGTP triphosphohydrolase